MTNHAARRNDRKRYGLQPGDRGYKPSDAGKRIADQYALHRIADPYGSVGKWFMARLYDGSQVDGTLYPSKIDAIRHAAHNEKFYVFIQVTPATMTAENADALLNLYRRVYDTPGLRFTDPDHARGGMEPIRRLTQRDQRNQIRALFGTGKPSNLEY